MKTYALIGRNISYSFSRNYFSEKFLREGITDSLYINFDIQTLDELPALLKATPTLKGMNVTIPYKRDIISLLAAIEPTAHQIGAVNTIKPTPIGLIGYNTDYYGFTESLKPLLQLHHTQALILGTGGASGAVAYSLQQLGIGYTFVSRNPKEGQLSYHQLTPAIIEAHTLIINCTPLGTYPNITDCPPLPYQYLSGQHLLYDLIYNPTQTTFLALGAQQGATTCNGQKMLELQAEKAWEIWNS
ncbi:shikimate dehydrogenase [Capnocytophaga bilenii]|uniref:shikimate dehydrogenase family protein n=1 Tax=Capnocytophaga bilenii TaxID=2819369 RepID=UPI0028D603B1|nr:shikimate dehydrogenase [Capnocytophaga bilenii]